MAWALRGSHGKAPGAPGASGGGFGYFFTDLVDVADFIEAAKEKLNDQLAKGKKNGVDADMAVDQFDRTYLDLSEARLVYEALEVLRDSSCA